MWSPDRFLPGYEAHRWVIDGAERAEGEPHVDLTATLVRRNPPRHQRAVLYVHGWNDYFFQTHLADFWDSIGFDFYAVDLRRYGRNLRRGLYAGYITSIRDYDAELDEAYRLIRADGHDRVTISGHSTGGLTVSLWADSTESALNGVVLNSPWLDMSFPAAMTRLAGPLMSSWASISPTAIMAKGGVGVHAQSLHSSLNGEWDYDLNYKSHVAFSPRVGWGRAVMVGQARVAAGLHISTPVLALMSATSVVDPETYDDEQAHSNDVVLDVDRMKAACVNLGDHVTIVRVLGAMHDTVLSREPVRKIVLAEMSRWALAYLA